MLDLVHRRRIVDLEREYNELLSQHTACSAKRFRAWIPEQVAAPLNEKASRLFISIAIVNLGQPTSVHTWFVRHMFNDVNWNHLSNRMFVRDDEVTAPRDIKRNNWCLDSTLLETGETRFGWVAFDLAEDCVQRAMTTVVVTFVDAFGNKQEVSGGDFASWITT
jgi:hypothetical protein